MSSMNTLMRDAAGPCATVATQSFHAMRADEFVRSAVAIVVNPAMVSGAKRLVSAAGSEAACESVRREIQPLAPPTAADPVEWAHSRFNELLADCFADDAWISLLPSGRPIVLIKGAAIDGRMDLQEALRRVHVQEVANAITEGLEVPQSVLDDYRRYVQSMTDREVH